MKIFLRMKSVFKSYPRLNMFVMATHASTGIQHSFFLPENVTLDNVGGEWMASWTDGDISIAHYLHARDRLAAEAALKNLLTDYIREKFESHHAHKIALAIHSASDVELLAMAHYLRAEMSARSLPLNLTLETDGVLRVKDVLNKYYSSIDYGKHAKRL